MNNSENINRFETVYFASLLTGAAGGLDAYSYLLHGEVFAGLQTGNIILLGLHLSEFDILGSLKYIIAIISFVLGTMIIRYIQEKFTGNDGSDNKRKRFVMLYEISLLVIAVILGNWLPNYLTTAILSVAAAAELQEFRKMRNGPFTPLMMTGNLRTISEAIYESVVLNNGTAVRKMKDTATIMFTFILGASLTGITVHYLGVWAVLVSIIFLLLAWKKSYPNS